MKLIYNILYSLLFIAGVSSCVTEDAFTDCPDIGNAGSGKRAQVMLNLSVPNNQMPSTARSITNEKAINTLYVLEFEDGILKEKIDITEKYNNSNGKSLYVAIEETDKPVSLSLVANADVATLEIGKSNLGNTKKALTFSDANNLSYTPMYGETKTFDNITRNQKYDVNVELVRSLVKIEVQYNSTQPKSEFEFLGIEVINVNTNGYVAAGQSISTGNTNLTVTPDIQRTEPNRLEIASVYIGETKNDNNKISVLVHGKYFGIEGYYRLDMIKNSGEKVGVLERNYRYVFSLQNVNYEGRPDRASALNGPSDNEAVQANVMTIKDSDILDITTDDQYFLGVNSSTLQLEKNSAGLCFTKLKILTDNTTEEWTIADYPKDGVEFNYNQDQIGSTIAATSVWIYVDLMKIKESFNFYVKIGKIRKTITVNLPK